MEEQTIKSYCQKWKEPWVILKFLAVILLAVIIIISILRDRIVSYNQNQITVMGRGEVEYKPDMAAILLGVQVDKASTPEEALNQMNEKINKIIAGIKSLGIEESEVSTQQYNLYPQYDYKDGTSNVSGYNANQQISVKVKNITDNGDLVSKVVSTASGAGANQVMGIDFEISDINSLKQQARVLAIKDARNKSQELAKAAGIKKLGKVASWYENILQSPDNSNQPMGGYGAGGAELSTRASVSPNVPSGNQKIVIEVGVNFETK